MRQDPVVEDVLRELAVEFRELAAGFVDLVEERTWMRAALRLEFRAAAAESAAIELFRQQGDRVMREPGPLR